MVVGDDSTETEMETEVAVVGGGPGGYVAAIRAAQRGLDVTLIEREGLGGVCLNHGCIPSKALVSATDVAHRAATAEEMGVHADPEIDAAAMGAWKDDVVARLSGGVGKLCKANGVSVVEGTARFADERRLRVSRGEGDPETIGFEHAVVATGSRPIELPGFAFDDEPVLSSRQLLAFESVPDSLVVVGAGYIGMELSTLLAKQGVDVTVVEMLDEPLPGYAADLSRPVVDRAETLGVDFHFGLRAREWRADGDGIVVVTEDGAGTTEFAAERVLVAVGREPVTDTLDPEAAGLEPDADGFLATDERMRTGVDGILAVGDVAGEPMLAHRASAEGRVAAATVAGESAARDRRAVPAAVFTDPEIATVGLTEAAAREAGVEPAVGEFPLRASGRALTRNDPEGLVRIVADAETGTVLGGAAVGVDASELIAELGLAVELDATLEEVAATIHTHPTLGEAVMEAAENALGEAIHTLNR